MRILHVYRTYFPDSQGGLEEVIRQICINSADHGVESRVFTLSKQHATPVIDREEAQVVRASLDVEIASCSMSLHALGKFRKQVEWADLVHYHFPWPFARGNGSCLLYTSPSPRDLSTSRMPSSA